MLTKDVLTYIISFLTRDENVVDRVGYTDDVSEFHRYSVVIIPSGFFREDVYATERTIPSLPLSDIQSIPLLFGTPHTEWVGDTLVTHADIIASTFFLVTRYEECVNQRRDVHQRFSAQHSFLKQAGLLLRPLVDEYACVLRGWLRETGMAVKEESNAFSAIYLTHDVDCLDYYHSLRGTLGGIKRVLLKETDERWLDIRRSWSNIELDPAYEFPWMAQQNALLPKARVVYFMKAVGRYHRYDRPLYDLQSQKLRRFYRFCQESGAEMGLHCSYLSGERPALLYEEKQRLEQALHIRITQTRYHYLRSCSYRDMQVLNDMGVKHDFTMAFADEVGFRLGTTRPVRWINPETMQLTSLVLHPLTLMECTLMESRYMSLSYTQALHVACQLINQVYKHAGELVLLFHNTSFAGPLAEDYRALYTHLLQYVQELLHDSKAID